MQLQLEDAISRILEWAKNSKPREPKEHPDHQQIEKDIKLIEEWLQGTYAHYAAMIEAFNDERNQGGV